MMEVKISEDLVKRVDKYVKDGRYKSFDEFVKAALETLLMAEDRKELFTKAIILDGRKDLD